MHVRKGDNVEVITGDDKVTGRVLRVLPEKGKVVVEGVNRVYKHLKPSRRNAQGGRLSKEMPIDASNVLLYCPTCRRGVRVGHAYDPNDGHKYRFCKKCKNNLGTLSKSRKAYVRRPG
jgi:large subunit ribosomal protein L24